MTKQINCCRLYEIVNICKYYASRDSRLLNTPLLRSFEEL